MTGHATHHDPRIAAGLTAQRALVRSAELSGAAQVGWKAGFGSASGRALLAIDAPLVGALLDSTRVAPGAAVDLRGWQEPRAEPEVALRLATDVPGGATPEAALRAVAAVAVAIELVDIAPPPSDVTAVLAGNVYHRHWATGPFLPIATTPSLATAAAHITSMGTALDPVVDVLASTGPVEDVLAEVARIAALSGRGLRAGDIVIVGSMIPPQPVAAGGSFEVVLDGHPAIEVRFA